ncbi:MAG: thioredoxin domain-containing protein [Myxococcales bacterium]|nr:thioredoxin domain-containing protein [Myxococcales bacterium]
MKDYEGDVKIAFKHFVVHPQSATEPALAACAAGLQGKFSEMEKAIWEKAYPKRDFKPASLEAIAKGVGLDIAKYTADKAGACKKQIGKDQSDLRNVGTSGTPAFYINGRFLSGARPVDQFKKLVDEELKKANARIAKGEATVADYYDKFVVKKGLKKLAPMKK